MSSNEVRGTGSRPVASNWLHKYLVDDRLVRRFRGRLNSYFGHLFGPESIAEFQQAIVEKLLRKLSDKDPARVDSEGYVWVTFCNAVRDLYRSLYGRHEVPDAVKRLGDGAERVWQLFCLDRLPDDEIKRVLDGVVSRVDVEAWVLAIKRDRACPEQVRKAELQDLLTRYCADIDDGPEIRDPEPDYRSIDQAEIQKLLFYVIDFSNGHETARALSQKVFERAVAIREALALSDDERLFLRLCFHSGFTFKQAGEQIGGAFARNPYRAAERLIKRVQAAFEDNGIRLADLGGED